MSTVEPISEMTFRFKVSDISKLTRVFSPEVIVQGVPWHFQVVKECVDAKHSIAIYLYSAKEEAPPGWTHAASAVIKLLSFDRDQDPLEYPIEPCVFNANGTGYGEPSLISWDELFDDRKKYVENDSIELDLKIKAEDPNVNNRSKLKLEIIDKSCECDSHAKFRLAVTNIKQLMSVRSPEFMLRNLSWNLSILKNATNVAIRLEFEPNSKDIKCNIKMSVKLMSSKGPSVRKIRVEDHRCCEFLTLKDLISWEELLNPENGFVKDDCIELKVKVKLDELRGALPNELKDEKKPKKLECAICLEQIDGQEVSSALCGHLFCTQCIVEAVKNRQFCPSCQAPVALDGIRRTYLPL